jgi:hypothetical protein
LYCHENLWKLSVSIVVVEVFMVYISTQASKRKLLPWRQYRSASINKWLYKSTLGFETWIIYSSEISTRFEFFNNFIKNLPLVSHQVLNLKSVKLNLKFGEKFCGLSDNHIFEIFKNYPGFETVPTPVEKITRKSQNFTKISQYYREYRIHDNIAKFLQYYSEILVFFCEFLQYCEILVIF